MKNRQRMQNADKQNRRQGILNPSKKSIKLNRNDKRLLLEQNFNETGFFNYRQTQIQVQKQGQEKLIQLTSQCVQYFQRFTAEKDAHLQIVDRAFSEVTNKVQIAFERIILQAQKKLSQIRTFLTKEHQKLKQQKTTQEQQLNKLLVQIKSVHLTKLDSSVSYDLTQTLADYAATLDKFFNVMTDIQGNSYQDSVEECISFINNLVRQELKTIEDKFPPKIQEIIGQFAPGEEFFTFEEDGIKANEQSVSLFEQMDRPNKENYNISNALSQIQNIKNSQNVRQGRINQYRSMVISNNPFTAIKLSKEPKKREV